MKRKSLLTLNAILHFFFSFAFAQSREITIGIGSVPEPADIPFTRSINKGQVLRQIYETPLAITASGEYRSAFFDEWIVHLPSKTLRLKLKSELKYSDGRPITAEALISVLERKFDDSQPILPEVTKIVRNGDTLTLNLRALSPRFLDKLTDSNLMITGAQDAATGFPAATSAFVILSKGSEGGLRTYHLARNSHYRGDLNGNISKLRVIELPKSTYTQEEMKKIGVDFFPLMRIDPPDAQIAGFKRTTIPQHRVTLLVANHPDIEVRKLLRACVSVGLLRKLPYFNDLVPYESLIPPGLENYQPESRLATPVKPSDCALQARKVKKGLRLKWLNTYREPADLKIIEEIVKSLNNVLGEGSVTLLNESLPDAQKRILDGSYDIFLCSVGASVPIFETVLRDFIQTSKSKTALVKFKDSEILSRFNRLGTASNEERLALTHELVALLVVEKAYVLPIGRKLTQFYIPEKWKDLHMTGSMNGNFYLGSVRIE